MRGKALDASLSWEGARFPEANFHQGTMTPVAAPEVDAGAAAGKCSGRPGTMEFLNFLRRIEAEVPDGLNLRPVMDSHETYRTVKTGHRLARRRHRHVHFTPTSIARLNRIEHWFADLTGKRLQLGAHRPVVDRDAEVMSLTDAHNGKPKACWWVKPARGPLRRSVVSASRGA